MMKLPSCVGHGTNDVEKKARMKEIKRKTNERGIGFDVGNSGHGMH